MSQDIMFLTPGSVWLKSDGSKSTVLCITNGSLPAKVQEKFPPQVIYYSEEGDILSQPVDFFMERRQFHNVDPETEATIDALIARITPEIEETDDMESDEEELILAEDGEVGEDEFAPGEDGAEVVAEGSEEAAPKALEAAVTEPDFISFSSVAEGLEIAAMVLSECAVSYEQQPMISEGYISHIIEFDRAKLASAGVTPFDLNALFNPDSEKVLPVFAVNQDYVVDWSAFLGVYPRMSRKKALLSLHLATEAVPAQNTPANTSTTPEAAPKAEAGVAPAAEAEAAVVTSPKAPAQIKVA